MRRIKGAREVSAKNSNYYSRVILSIDPDVKIEFQNPYAFLLNANSPLIERPRNLFLFIEGLLIQE